MKIGIFIGYRPNQQLASEGLGRYMALLIKGLMERGNEIFIATPKWSIESLNEVLIDCNVDVDNVQIITTEKIPIVWNVFYLLQKKFKIKKKKKNKFKKYIKESLLTIIENIITVLLTTCNIFLFILLIGLLIMLMPLIILVIGTVGFLLLFIYRGVCKIKSKAPKKIKNIGVILYRKLKIRDIFEKNAYKVEISKIIQKVNSMDKVEIWYSPTLFWSQFNNIKKPRVLCAPDLVLLNYPIEFSSDKSSINIVNELSETIESGEFFITYSEFIRDTLLVDYFSKKVENIKVVPHGCNSLSNYIDFEEADLSAIDFKKSIINRNFATSKIEEHANLYFTDEYKKNFKFKDIKYIFYASQDRPYKNILNLIKAYEYLINEYNLDLKLFLTCSFSEKTKIGQYINQNNLKHQIFSFSKCSAQTLASLYNRAELVVNPTLYEGGFPFTFVEAYSVGTPSILSNIPQVSEAIRNINISEMTFDPYNYIDIAKSIIWAIENKESLLKKQQGLYKLWGNRTWDIAAKEYEEAFAYFLKEEDN